MALAPGTRLGPYEVTAQIGVGGMGEVYRATDTKLGRDVAIKVLPDLVAQDAERLARFDREAKTLAALNHPGIAAIYGLEESDGVQALVMELVEGPTLAARIAEGPMPVDEALPIARQIAEALEAAHEQGIIHRDLKPANIKVREDGTVKVLDFGLAKAMDPVAGSSPNLSMSPTITTPAMTEMGMILGTAAYMSPEQAKGKGADRRSDVWAFGAVLYEMVTGRRAFAGDDVSDTMASVLKADTDWNAFPAGVPATVVTVIRRCLQRDRSQRIRDIGDVRLALEGAFETAATQESAASSAVPPLWRRSWPWTAAAVAIAVAATVFLRPPADVPVQPVRRLAEVLSPSLTLPVGSGTLVAISPDGETLIYRARDGTGTWRLFRRDSDELAASPVPGTEDAQGEPSFSPDGRWLAFRAADNTLMTVLLAGGRPVEIGAASNFRGVAWLPDGSFILGNRTLGLAQVSEAGDVTPLTASDDAREYWYPQLLPDGRHVLFTASEAVPDAADLFAFDRETSSVVPVLPRASAGRYVAAGYLTFVRGGDLWAVRFDPGRLEVQGEPRLVEPGIRVESGGAVQVAVADDGTIAYIPGDVETAAGRTLVWLDRNGQEERIDVPPEQYTYPRLSADGARVALATGRAGADAFVWDLARGLSTNVTASEAVDQYALWAPDGRSIIFSSNPEGPRRLYRQSADGTGTPEALTVGGDPSVIHYPQAVWLDASGTAWVVYREVVGGNIDLRMVSLEGDHETRDLLSTEFDELNAEVSPNGRWLAYQSDRAGRDDIYVSPFPDVMSGDRKTISPAGGTRPAWAPDGRELVYLDMSGQLMSVEVDPDGDDFVYGSAERLLDVTQYFTGTGRSYDFDGERFLFVKNIDAQSDARAEIYLVRNWFDAPEGRTAVGE